MTSQALVDDFLNIFQTLTPAQQRVWRYLQRMGRDYRSVFPSQTTIGKVCRCCRDTALQAVKKLSELGWLGVINRNRRSCLYFIPDQLQDVDVDNPETFRRQHPETRGNPTANPTQTRHYSKDFNRDNMNGSLEDRGNVQNTEKKISVSSALREVPLALQDKVVLSRYSDGILHLALEDAQTYGQIKRIRNLAAFLVSRCKEYYEKLRKKLREERGSHSASDRLKTLLNVDHDYNTKHLFGGTTASTLPA